MGNKGFDQYLTDEFSSQRVMGSFKAEARTLDDLTGTLVGDFSVGNALTFTGAVLAQYGLVSSV